MKEMVTLSKKEQKRLIVLNQVEMGKVIGREASEVLDLSLASGKKNFSSVQEGGRCGIGAWQSREKASQCLK